MRVLIIEDEEDIASFISSGLGAECFAVDWAADGNTGLNYAKNNDYDLIILDIKLPGINGMDICRTLRDEGKTIPILMLSIENNTFTKVEALNIGADDYLAKPFSFEELLARIRALLRREKSITSNILRLVDLEMDILAHVVKRSGKIIKLSKKEFSLLEYFMKHPGMILSRNMILEHVWRMDTDPFTNTVDVHVRFLRKKIDKNHKRKLIHTIHGYGYKME